MCGGVGRGVCVWGSREGVCVWGSKEGGMCGRE